MMNGNERRRQVEAFFCGVAVTLLLGTIGASMIRHKSLSVVEVPFRARHLPAARQLSDGPWGRLEAVPIPFVNPGNETPERELLQAPKWFFEAFCEQQLTEFLSSCPLT